MSTNECTRDKSVQTRPPLAPDRDLEPLTAAAICGEFASVTDITVGFFLSMNNIVHDVLDDEHGSNHSTSVG